MAASRPRFALPRSNLGAVSETPAAPISTDVPPAAATSGAAGSATASPIDGPARGRETRLNLLSKLRAPPLVHTWDFWHEKPDPAAMLSPAMPTPSGVPFSYPSEQARVQQQNYEPILTNLLNVSDIKTFWSLFNNFDFNVLPQRSSAHLFHTTVKPVWEDPRNVKGGAWTFRVPKAAAVDFWQQICLLAIGEHLQEAVRSNRVTFRDDICGVSFRPRFSSVLITIWNRDGAHEEGIQRISETVVKNMPEHLKPKEGSFYYKKHSDHAGFDAEVAKKNVQADVAADKTPSAPPPTATIATEQQLAEEQHASVNMSVDEVSREVEKVKRALERVELDEAEIAAKVDAEAAP